MSLEPNSSAEESAVVLPETAVLPEAEPQTIVAMGSRSVLGTLRRNGKATLKYLTTTEVHTYAFSVAANAILSFVPAVVMMMTLSLRVFHSPKMFKAIIEVLHAYMPVQSQDLGIINRISAVAVGHKVQIFSIVMLFVSCTGIFLPLEVALNSVWGIKKNRSYLMNQVVSLGLALACGVLGMLSIFAVAQTLPLKGLENTILQTLGMGVVWVAAKVFALIASILVFFLIYWLLPNGKVPPLAVVPAAIITGVCWALLEALYVLALPLLDFRETYGPFALSVTLIFWSYISGMLMLGGAHLSAADHMQQHAAAESKVSEN